MKTIPRRTFLKSTSRVCLGGCMLMAFPHLRSMAGIMQEGEKPDPRKLNYCGYTCPEECKFRKATLANDAELKKEAFGIWKIEERYGVSFDADKAFCHGCKTDKPAGVVTANCTVRSCAMEKGLDACIECDELTTCDKDLWTRFPEFYKQVIQMQERYRSI